CAGSTSTTYW
nr:immunoglobulin heavy chain junction region [Macaca mulatta]